jgi:3',5'-cyclic AMP phosphodiesterase CpdA
MNALIQISDPHFGTEQPPVVEALVRLVHQQAPQLVVLSGDITQRAHRQQFRAARRFIDRLGVPATLAIPGNHDIPLFNPGARLFKPYANHKREFGPDLEPIFESDWLLAIALNTTRRLRHKDGVVSKAQIDRVAQRLERAAPSQLRIVVIHQPVCVTLPEDEVNLLHGRADAVRRWSDAGADLILGGHIHLPYVRGLAASFGGLRRELYAVQAGTAVSRRLRRDTGNSVNVIRYGAVNGERCCIVERWDYQPAAENFAQAGRDELRLAPLAVPVDSVAVDAG